MEDGMSSATGHPFVYYFSRACYTCRRRSSVYRMFKTEKRNIEKIVLVVFAILLIIAQLFHEPWFDEAQAWQIARSASYKDMILTLPHYEGHPPFWHLLLSIPAKLGAPYELSLKTISFIPAFLSALLLLFRSPFPLIIRCTLPFTYFFFYQYAVLSRPYGFLVLGFLLLACIFEQRDEKPVLFVAVLAYICMWSAYGIIIAGGIALAWFVDIVRDKKLITLKKTLALSVLFVFAMFLIANIIPSTGVEGMKEKSNAGVGVTNVLCIMFASVSECLFTDNFSGHQSIDNEARSIADIGLPIILGMLGVYSLLVMSAAKKLKYFLIPYIFFTVFATVVYLYTHHIGILFAFVVFYAWIILADDEEDRLYKLFFKRRIKYLSTAGTILVMFMMSSSLIWTVSSVCLDIKYEYYYARDLAAFMIDHGLAHAKIFTPWNSVLDEEGNVKQEVNMAKYFVSVLPYMDDDSYVANLNLGRKDMAYTIHVDPDKDEVDDIIEQWRNMGYPEVVTRSTNLKVIFPDQDIPEYVPVYRITYLSPSIWKGKIHQYGNDYLCVREDVLDKYGLQPIEIEE